MILSKLSPAETLFLQHGAETPLKDLLKYTFMDLLLKQVLQIEEVERQPHPSDPVRHYKYISAGKRLDDYTYRMHEFVFLSAFEKSPGLRILFRNFVRLGYENAATIKSFHVTMISLPALDGAFSRSILQRIVGGFDHSRDGLILKSQVEKELQELEATIPDLLRTDRKKGLEILKSIGGNIFLLTGVEFALLAEIDEALLRELAQPEVSMGGCSIGCSTWTAFDTHSSDFDSSCSSPGTSSDGGDSGCSSGCSGCSGCGGCGGGD